MIKLNNKKITYIALADTNNSIKAPKEIWYADSANSVKLVYRRKDALIEGEDYEKYHWLKGDDSAYIQGIAFDLWNNHFNARIGKNERLQYFNYYVHSTAANFKIEVDNNISIPYLLAIFRNAENGVHIDELRPYSAMPDVVDYDFYIDNSTFYCNRDGVIHTNSGTNIAIESNWTSIQPMIKSAKISYIREVLPNDTYRSNLIPCKLLKPVPKWLDANGIRRQVGECGMIDLVSGKFYGNVNSVGTFTVENYYERKEWLQGRNGAYISTNHKAYACKDKYICHFAWDGSESNPENKLNGIFGCKNGDTYIRAGIRAGKFYFDYANCPPFNAQISISQPYEGTVEMYSDESSGNSTVIYNGITNTFSNNSLSKGELLGNVMVFENIANNNTYFQGDISSFKILDTDNADATIMNLIPCTLTMDLPASMDANNIARTKGTSGMWDLVSDRFYGNVANSGTFKAVNLAEGVDYEVHQWLVGDGTAYIDTGVTSYSGVVDIKLSVGSFVGTILGRALGNDGDYSKRFFVGRYTSYGIYGNNQAPSTLIVNDSVLLTIDIDNGIATDNYGNTTSISIIGNVVGNSMYLFCANKDNVPVTPIFNGKIGLFNISSIINLIPVKLLRSIPSKYDANGIARNAGECGMYDTVNDVFYGNVANSGTFSVSDDS